MGVAGNGPKPFKQAQLRTTFLRVPAIDWSAVKLGTKTEFRAAGGAMTAMWRVECPAPVVIWRKTAVGYDSALMVLEATWRERLIDISEESLRREGLSSVDEFRRYWVRRERRRFMPMNEVSVYRLRPWCDDDLEIGQRLLERLYGEFM